MASAASTAWTAWSASSSGAFQNAMIASPIYLSIVPPAASTAADSGLSSRLHQRGQPLRLVLQRLRNGGEAAHVAEQDRQRLALAAETQPRRVGGQPLDQDRRQILREGARDVAPAAAARPRSRARFAPPRPPRRRPPARSAARRAGRTAAAGSCRASDSTMADRGQHCRSPAGAAPHRQRRQAASRRCVHAPASSKARRPQMNRCRVMLS